MKTTNMPTKSGKLDVENNIRFGNVCENEKGEYGVFYRYRGSGSRKWIGINLENNEQWIALTKPTVLFETVKEYVQFMVATGSRKDPDVYREGIK